VQRTIFHLPGLPTARDAMERDFAQQVAARFNMRFALTEAAKPKRVAETLDALLTQLGHDDDRQPARIVVWARNVVRPGLPNSVEEYKDSFYVPMRDGDRVSAEPLDDVRLGRAIGVIYRPETERQATTSMSGRPSSSTR
jgi:erythromycin esterase-like protein